MLSGPKAAGACQGVRKHAEDIADLPKTSMGEPRLGHWQVYHSSALLPPTPGTPYAGMVKRECLSLTGVHTLPMRLMRHISSLNVVREYIPWDMGKSLSRFSDSQVPLHHISSSTSGCQTIGQVCECFDLDGSQKTCSTDKNQAVRTTQTIVGTTSESVLAGSSSGWYDMFRRSGAS